ncbi:MAG: outer membrane protein assembly factor BamD [Planctomycetia bacterium]|jgi:outer membrane protein assembly factor BamD (BamD/ComL family)
MVLKNEWSRLGLLGVVILVMSGCMSLPGTAGRMKPLPNWMVGKKPPAQAPAGPDGIQGMKPNASGIQQVAAIGPVTNPTSSLPPSAMNQVSGLDAERLEKPKAWWDVTQFSPTEISDGFKATFGIDPNEDRARVIYKQAVSYYKQKHYSAAAKRFKRAAARWPDSLLEEDALFYQGESHFFADEYTKAQDAFGELLKKHGNTRYLDTVSKRLFAIAQYWEKAWEAKPHWPITPNVTDKTQPLFDTWGYGIKAYEMIAMNDPTGPLADDSLMALANAYFRRKRYLDSADYYDRVRADYPKSKYLIDAHFLAMKSHEMSYQGAEYDNTPLKKAEKIADTLLTQFGPRLGKEREKVLETKSRILAKLAEQDWAMAKFYEGKGQYGSARFYYNEIIQGYPGTPIAKSSQERLVQIKDKPEVTVNQFQALVDLLDPEDDPLAEIDNSQRSDARVARRTEEEKRGFWGGLIKGSAEQANRGEVEDQRQKDLWR